MAKDKQQDPEVVLVGMKKDGEAMKVHPTCVDAHINAGWVVAEDEAPAEVAE